MVYILYGLNTLRYIIYLIYIYIPNYKLKLNVYFTFYRLNIQIYYYIHLFFFHPLVLFSLGATPSYDQGLFFAQLSKITPVCSQRTI